MAAFRVVIFAVLVSFCVIEAHSDIYDLDRLREMFLEYNGAMPTTTEKPERDNPFESDDPRVAHIDFLVGRFDLASGQGCTSPGCYSLAKRMEGLIIDYNVKVMKYVGSFDFEEYNIKTRPLSFRTIDIVVVTVYHRMVPSSNATTTVKPTDGTPRPTGRTTGPTDGTPGPTTTTTPRPTTTTTARPTSTTTARPTTTTTSGGTGFATSYACGFEDDSNPICDAAQPVGTDDFDWQRHSGGTGSSGTGPSGAAVGDWYLYVEASSPRARDDTADLVLPAMEGGNYCATFDFYMEGQHTGSLQLLRMSGSESTIVWEQFEEVSTFQWNPASVIVSMSAGDQLMFHAIMGEDYQGDSSIDDILINRDLSRCSAK